LKVAETKLTDANLTTVPTPIREALKLNAGDYLEWHIDNDAVKVRKRFYKGGQQK